MPSDPPFSLCLTHDVDRPYKTFQAPYYAVRERDPSHLTSLLGDSPYWQFERVMALEEELGVRSAFYFLDERSLLERPVREWFSPTSWVRYFGRYDLNDPDIVDVIRRLDERGWEVGIHGSFESYLDRARLAAEKARLESVLGHPVTGGRQHYLNLDGETTWRYHADIGLRYDTSLGSSTDYGFDHGYEPLRPFDDEFVVFPLTLMENALPDPGSDFRAAWDECESLLEEAAANGAVMTVLWHPRFFNAEEFPGYGRLYRRLIEAALDRGAWVGSPGQLYERMGLEDPRSTDSSGGPHDTERADGSTRRGADVDPRGDESARSVTRRSTRKEPSASDRRGITNPTRVPDGSE